MSFNRKFLSILLCCSSLFVLNIWAEAIPELPAEEINSPHTTDNKDQEAQIVSMNTSSSDNQELRPSGFPRYFSAVDITGYMRMRFNYFRNPHLQTYIKALGRGTSNFRPELSSYPTDGEGSANPHQNIYSANMRLRLNPTINISEVTRIKTSLDIFDNLVLGSTPSYMGSRASFMSMSQDAVDRSVNSWQGALRLRRAWGEANFPIGELRFGRMPMHWGLGILYNSGDTITNDYGDQIDGIMFTTRILDHLVTPSYSIAYTGPIGRGGGHFAGADSSITHYLRQDAGHPYSLESSDIAHVLSLSILKRDADFIAQKKREENRALFNYGLFASYRTQKMDSHHTDANVNNILVKRDGHVGMSSLWTSFSYKTFHIEAEFAGILGKYRIGEKDSDPLALSASGPIPDRDVWLLQGGLAVESKYGFLNDRLQVGLDLGLASAQEGPGFGINEQRNLDPKPGDTDGQKLPAANKYKTNFKFNSAYNVDLLLYKEVLGGITGTYYFKPHISYFFSRNFGVRGDAISSFALNKSNTSGNSSLLGIELDASAFLRTDNGFYLSLAYGILFPLKGLNHARQVLQDDNQHKIFGSAQIAQTLQCFVGLMF
jgi:uncharacterized protein (TIGR04551 family)